MNHPDRRRCSPRLPVFTQAAQPIARTAGAYRAIAGLWEADAARIQREDIARGLAYGAPISLLLWMALIWALFA